VLIFRFLYHQKWCRASKRCRVFSGVWLINFGKTWEHRIHRSPAALFIVVLTGFLGSEPPPEVYRTLWRP